MLRQLTIKFLHRVRIHGGEFDSSARAMNRAEGSNSLQADLRKFRGSTFERKQMSTTIKRIALVAVAALGLGVVSVAPSSAMTFSDSLTLSSATASQLTSETATATSAVATLTFLSSHVDDSMSVTATLVSAPAGNTALPYLLLSETTSAEAKQGTTVLTSTDNTGVAAGVAVLVAPKSATLPVNATAKFKVFMNAPTKVGTYVVKLTPAVVTGGGTLAGSAQTLTITVTQNAATDTVVASADSIINAGETSSATADVTVTGSKTASTSVAAATIKVTLKNANGNIVSAESYTATIAGPGILGSGEDTATTITGPNATGRAITVKAGDVVQVFPDGSSGVATITIGSAAGVILATEKVTFFGDAAKIVTTVKKAVIGGGSTSTADVLSIVVTDAAGTTVSNLTSVNIVSSDVTKIAGAYTAAAATYSATTGAYLVPLTGVAAGTANITVTTKASATATTGVDAAAVSVRVGSSTPAAVKVSLDKSSYAPGEKATLSVVLTDADGLVLADGTYASIFATGGIVGNYTINGDTTTATSVLGFASGTKDYTIYMPVTEGDVKFAWTTGTGLATANQGVEGSITASVSSAATSSAIDAANEASQAASDATDAALAAADAADEATSKAQEAVDAVATLSAEVSKMINALKAQIKTLSNLVTKIAKKVKA